MSKETALQQALGNVATIPMSAEVDKNPILENTSVAIEEKKESKSLDSTRLAHIAKKEALLVKDREAFKRERDDFLKEKEIVESIKQESENFKSLKSKDPIAALKLLGFTETDIFNYMSEQNQTPEQKAERAAMAKIEEFEARQNKLREEQLKAQQEAQAKRDAEAITSYKETISKEIQAKKDIYEFVAFHGPVAEDLVFETIQQVFDAEKIIIPIDEALKLVESYYEEMDKEMSTLKKRTPREIAIDKIKETVTKQEPLKAEVAPMPTKQQSNAPSRTLTSKQTATVASNMQQNLSRSDKKRMLVERLRNLGKA